MDSNELEIAASHVDKAASLTAATPMGGTSLTPNCQQRKRDGSVLVPNTTTSSSSTLPLPPSRARSSSSCQQQQADDAQRKQQHELMGQDDQLSFNIQNAAMKQYAALLHRIPPEALHSSERMQNLASLCVNSMITAVHERGGLEVASSPRTAASFMESSLTYAATSFAHGGVSNAANERRAQQFLERSAKSKLTAASNNSIGGGGCDWVAQSPLEDPLRLRHLESFLVSIRAKVEDCVTANDYAVRLYEILSRQYDVKAPLSTSSPRGDQLRTKLNKRFQHAKKHGAGGGSADDAGGEPADIEEAKRYIMRLRDRMSEMQKRLDIQKTFHEKLGLIHETCKQLKAGAADLRQSTRFQVLDLLDFHREQSEICRPLLGGDGDKSSTHGVGLSIVKQGEVEDEIRKMKEKNPLRDSASCFRFTLEQLLSEVSYLLMKNIQPKALKAKAQQRQSDHEKDSDGGSDPDDDDDENGSPANNDDDDLDNDEQQEDSDEDDENDKKQKKRRRKKAKVIKNSLGRIAREQAPRTAELGILKSSGWSALANYNKPGAELMLISQARDAARLLMAATEGIGSIMADYQELKANSLSTRREVERLRRDLQESQGQLQHFLDKELEEKKSKKGAPSPGPKKAPAPAKTAAPADQKASAPKGKPTPAAASSSASSPPGKNVSTSVSGTVPPVDDDKLLPEPPADDVAPTDSFPTEAGAAAEQREIFTPVVETPEKETSSPATTPATVKKIAPAAALSKKVVKKPTTPSTSKRDEDNCSKNALSVNHMDTQTDDILISTPRQAHPSTSSEENIDDSQLLSPALTCLVRALLSELMATSRELLLPLMSDDEGGSSNNSRMEDIITELSAQLLPEYMSLRRGEAAFGIHDAHLSAGMTFGGGHAAALDLERSAACGSASGGIPPAAPVGASSASSGYVPAFSTQPSRQPQVFVTGVAAAAAPLTSPRPTAAGGQSPFFAAQQQCTVGPGLMMQQRPQLSPKVSSKQPPNSSFADGEATFSSPLGGTQPLTGQHFTLPASVAASKPSNISNVTAESTAADLRIGSPMPFRIPPASPSSMESTVPRPSSVSSSTMDSARSPLLHSALRASGGPSSSLLPSSSIEMRHSTSSSTARGVTLLPHVGSRVSVTLSPIAMQEEEDGIAVQKPPLPQYKKGDNISASSSAPLGQLRSLPGSTRQQTDNEAAAPVRSALPRVLLARAADRASDEDHPSVDQFASADISDLHDTRDEQQRLLRRLQLSKELMTAAIGKHQQPPKATLQLVAEVRDKHNRSALQQHPSTSVSVTHPVLQAGGPRPTPSSPQPRQLPFAPTAEFAPRPANGIPLA